MSDQSTQRPAAFTALVALIDHLLSDPRTAHLAKGGIWGIQPGRHHREQISLIQHIESDDPQAVLDYLSTTLGGTFAPDGPAGEAYIWNVMAIKWQGASVELKLAAPGLSAEEQLRARVAELEAELAARRTPTEDAAYRAALLVQRHELEDPAVPPLAWAEPAAEPPVEPVEVRTLAAMPGGAA